MNPSKIAVFFVVGLCAIQCLHANPLDGIVDKMHEIIKNVDDAAKKFEENAWKELSGMRKDIANVPKCMQSEIPKVKALINQAEQYAMQCLTTAISEAQPAAQKLGKIVREIIPLARQVVPAVTECEVEHSGNPITLTICVLRVVGPKVSEIKGLMGEIESEIPELRDLVQNKLIPLLRECSGKMKVEVKQVQDLIAELKTCVANGQ